MGLAADTLTWLDSQETSILTHEGAAFEEVELLRLMLNGASGTGGVMSAAYRNKLTSYVPGLNGRAQARAYAHIVMFASDFGLDPISHPAEVNLLLEDSILENQNDTDTLGELLIAAHLLGVTSPTIEATYEKFVTDWSAIPRVFDNYHPVLVGGILFALKGI